MYIKHPTSDHSGKGDGHTGCLAFFDYYRQSEIKEFY